MSMILRRFPCRVFCLIGQAFLKKTVVHRLDQNTGIAPVRILVVRASGKLPVGVTAAQLSFLALHLSLRQEKIHKFIHGDPDPEISQQHYGAQALISCRPFICLFYMRNLQYSSHNILLVKARRASRVNRVRKGSVCLSAPVCTVYSSPVSYCPAPSRCFT